MHIAEAVVDLPLWMASHDDEYDVVSQLRERAGSKSDLWGYVREDLRRIDDVIGMAREEIARDCSAANVVAIARLLHAYADLLAGSARLLRTEERR